MRCNVLVVGLAVVLAVAATTVGCQRTKPGTIKPGFEERVDVRKSVPETRRPERGQPGRAQDIEQMPLDQPPQPDARKWRPSAKKLGWKSIYFAFDKSNLTAESRAILEHNAKILKDNPDIRVLIEGHCDERGTIEYNLALGERRALAARNYLINLGIDPNRIATISWGEERPADPGHNEEAWAKNRRDEFKPAD